MFVARVWVEAPVSSLGTPLADTPVAESISRYVSHSRCGACQHPTATATATQLIPTAAAAAAAAACGLFVQSEVIWRQDTPFTAEIPPIASVLLVLYSAVIRLRPS